MAVAAGTAMLIKKAGTTIAGVRTNKVSFSATPIDITSADDSGVRTLLPGGQVDQQYTLTISGVEKGGVLATAFAAPATTKSLTDITFTIPTESGSGDVFTGNVFLQTYDITGEYKDAVMFDATLISAGTWAAA